MKGEGSWEGLTLGGWDLKWTATGAGFGVESRKGLTDWEASVAGTRLVGGAQSKARKMGGASGLVGGATKEQGRDHSRWAGLGRGLCVRGRDSLGSSYSRSVRTLAPTPTPGLACNGSFDMYVCWDYTAPNATARASCPWYLPWHGHGELPGAPS